MIHTLVFFKEDLQKLVVIVLFSWKLDVILYNITLLSVARVARCPQSAEENILNIKQEGHDYKIMYSTCELQESIF